MGIETSEAPPTLWSFEQNKPILDIEMIRRQAQPERQKSRQRYAAWKLPYNGATGEESKSDKKNSRHGKRPFCVADYLVDEI